MIDRNTAADLLNFGARLGAGQRADEQLEGAVALHDMLCRRNVAYLADEVGMGKTYVALGVLALFRHYEPNFRVLVLTPRENIQQKWMKELRNFVSHNVRFADLRVKSLDGRPARTLVSCDNLLELVRETALDAGRDFFARLTSFSLPLSRDNDGWRRLRDSFREYLPWLADEVFDLRVSRETFKDNFARALCCALPVFDLVIVDEAHNLKHGFGEHGAARNRVLGLAFGHPSEKPDRRLFPGYGPRAKRVLFLSATPIEETYTHLWNQLNVFGHAAGFERLRSSDVSEADKKKLAAELLVRRVTTIQIGGEEHTKNLYRRDWRRGGVAQHDEPVRIVDDRQRLVVALVQKKVSELLRNERFNASFQIGMLASFESFLETAKVKRITKEEEATATTFDDSEQAERSDEREGIDVDTVNGLARDYRRRFQGRELPHPKMDAVVECVFRSTWPANPAPPGHSFRSTWPRSERSDVPIGAKRRSGRSEATSHRSRGRLDDHSFSSAIFPSIPFFFLIDGPFSESTCALWTRRSQMASARVGSASISCQLFVGTWLVTTVEQRS